MRTITKQLVLLAVVFIVYFGYSAWIDSLALYRIATAAGDLPAGFKIGDFITDPAIIETGMVGNVAITFTGIMAQNSLLYAILSPFKLVLVGGVFAMLIPLTKKLFFGTVIAIKEYVKNRNANLLYNYEAAISYVVTLKGILEKGDYAALKAHYATLAGVKFKPQFLMTLMNDISYALIRETDTSIFVRPSQSVIFSLKEMYDHEHHLALTGRPDENFHDLKAGYNYVSIGSKYNIEYYKSFSGKDNDQRKMGWKLFSLEMYKFYVSMIWAIIPAAVVIAVVLPIIVRFLQPALASRLSVLIIFLIYILFAILINFFTIFFKKQYKSIGHYLFGPAIIYYTLFLLLALTFAVSLIGLIELGNLLRPQTVTLMWGFISAIANLAFTTCLMLFVIATLMDGNVSAAGLKGNLAFDGIVLPLFAWALVIGFNTYGLYFAGEESRAFWTNIGFYIAVGFWIYLSVSGLLIRNIMLPSRNRKRQKPILNKAKK